MELLIMAVDTISNDKSKNIQLPKRGDVIAVKPDGSEWGLEELANPLFKLIQVPDMTELEANNLLQQEFPKPQSPNQPVMLRLFKLDLDTMIKNGLNIDKPRPITDKASAQTAITQKNLPKDLITDKASVISVQKPDSKDPNVIGPTLSDTIG